MIAERSLSANVLKHASAYVIELVGSQWLFVTGWREPITIKGLPANLGGGQKTFTPAQIEHASVKQVVGIDAQGTSVTTGVDNAVLRKVFLIASTNKVRVHIMRVNLSTKKEAYDYEAHCYVMDSGVISIASINGQQIECSLVPEVLAGGGQVPRAIFSRSCWKVFGQCGVNLNTIKIEAAIHAVDRVNRIITLASTVNVTRLAHGNMSHPATGQRVTVEWADNNGSGGKSRLRLRAWNPDFKVGDSVTIYPGCMLNTEACEAWGNLPNYGGFSFIPQANPVTAGG